MLGLTRFLAADGCRACRRPAQGVTSAQAFQGRRRWSARSLAIEPSAEALAGQDTKESFNGLVLGLGAAVNRVLSRANPHMSAVSAGRPRRSDGTSDASSTRLRSP